MVHVMEPLSSLPPRYDNNDIFFRLYLQHSEVGFGIGSNKGSFILVSGRCGDIDLPRILNDMVVGEHIAVLAEEEP